jgi:CBS domain-containing protein
MSIDEIMTHHPACCTPETPLREVARLMVEHNCGEIPLVQGPAQAVLLGVVTDRDIVCRLVARGENPINLTAADCMTYPAVSVATDASLDECCRIMEAHQIRRVPVVDEAGVIQGIVSQADIAMRAPKARTAQLVREVSMPAGPLATAAL